MGLCEYASHPRIWGTVRQQGTSGSPCRDPILGARGQAVRNGTRTDEVAGEGLRRRSSGFRWSMKTLLDHRSNGRKEAERESAFRREEPGVDDFAVIDLDAWSDLRIEIEFEDIDALAFVLPHVILRECQLEAARRNLQRDLFSEFAHRGIDGRLVGAHVPSGQGVVRHVRIAD